MSPINVTLLFIDKMVDPVWVPNLFTDFALETLLTVFKNMKTVTIQVHIEGFQIFALRNIDSTTYTFVLYHNHPARNNCNPYEVS